MTHSYARSTFFAFLAALAVAAVSTTAFAFHSPEHYELFGDASYVTPGNASNRAVELTSDTDPGYGGIEYGVEEGTTFADLETLSTDYYFEADDSCEGGSPRFQIGLSDEESGDEGNIFVYFGSEPNYNDCPTEEWTNTGDLLGSGSVDSSQLDGGTFYHSYEDALAAYGDYEVTDISVVVDASWAAEDSEQSVTIDNTVVNGTTFTYEVPTPTNKNECKNGGWMNLADANGNAFKNQGQCVASVATAQNN